MTEEVVGETLRLDMMSERFNVLTMREHARLADAEELTTLESNNLHANEKVSLGVER